MPPVVRQGRNHHCPRQAIPRLARERLPTRGFVVCEITPVNDYERSTKDRPVQQIDKDTALALWSIEVLDADPDAGKKNRTVSVKIAAKHQPVPAEVPTGTPFAPVEFDGLSALPYIDDSGTSRGSRGPSGPRTCTPRARSRPTPPVRARAARRPRPPDRVVR
jgi:hypothetical protein